MLITILATCVVLGVLIFVHELGHFAAAKFVDIEVPRFSIGLGPKMFGFTRGETEYVISWLPLGGYVKMAGMEEMEAIEGGPSRKATVTGAGTAVDLGVETEDASEARPRDFESKSLPARTLVISAGVIMNLIFAFLVFTCSALIWGVQVSPPARLGGVSEEFLMPGTEVLATLPQGTQVSAVNGQPVATLRDLDVALAKTKPGNVQLSFANHAPVTVTLQRGDSARSSLMAAFEPAVITPAVVGQLVKGSPADRAGLKPGDKIVNAGGRPIRNWQQLVGVVEQYGGRPLVLQVTRKGAATPTDITVTPEAKKLPNGKLYGRMGVYAETSWQDALPKKRPGPIAAVTSGLQRTWEVIAMTAGFLWDLVSGGASPRNLGGPILIGQLSGKVARLGLEAFLGFMALFSVNLAVLNLLPIPVLDGGHLMFLLVEAVRGRALSLEQRMRLSQVGFVIVVAIMVWAVANDVLRVFGI